MNLNFSISELIFSDTAIKNNINNMPDLKALDNLLNLIFYLLQPVRDKFGAIIVTSGFRSYYVNKLVGGVSNSNHLYGYAADIVPKQSTFKQVYDFIVNNLDYDECFIEQSSGKKWLHVAYRKGNNRKKHNPNYLI
jgi:hypothetical protein